MSVTVDGTSYDLPADEFTATKVASYNSLLQALQNPFTAWVPTWTNLTVGNGTVTAKYRQIGKLVIVRLVIVFGSTTSISGAVSFTLPVTRAAYAGTAGVSPLGMARFFDASPGAGYEGVVVTPSTTTAKLHVWQASGTYTQAVDLSSTVPVTWTTSDEIHVQLSYEAA